MRRGVCRSSLPVFTLTFRICLGIVLLQGVSRAWADSSGAMMEEIRARGYISCGVNSGLPGMAVVDARGVWVGFDVSFCRALAAAVLGDGEAVHFVPLSAQVRLEALTNRDVDLLARNTTWTYSRDAGRGLTFVGVNYYDGQGIMTQRSLGVDRLADLPTGTRICVQTGTTTIHNLDSAIAAMGLEVEVMVFGSTEEARSRFFMGECDAYTGDRSAIAAIRAVDAPRPEDIVVLSDVLSKEPLGPVVREDDPQWFDVVRWVLFAMIQAEEWGVGQATIETVSVETKDPALRRFLGLEPGIGAPLGLDDAWVRRIITQVGNYGEVFDRTLGADGPVGLDRGLNRLWTDGGLIYSPPFQ